jgi:cytochrome c553
VARVRGWYDNVMNVVYTQDLSLARLRLASTGGDLPSEGGNRVQRAKLRLLRSLWVEFFGAHPYHSAAFLMTRPGESSAEWGQMLFNRIRLVAVATAFIGATLGMPALADGAAADAARGGRLAYTCFGCHGVRNYRDSYPAYHVPKIGGQHQAYLGVGAPVSTAPAPARTRPCGRRRAA